MPCLRVCEFMRACVRVSVSVSVCLWVCVLMCVFLCSCQHQFVSSAGSSSKSWLTDPLADMRAVEKVQAQNRAGLERLIQLKYSDDLVIPFGCLAEVRAVCACACACACMRVCVCVCAGVCVSLTCSLSPRSWEWCTACWGLTGPVWRSPWMRPCATTCAGACNGAPSPRAPVCVCVYVSAPAFTVCVSAFTACVCVCVCVSAPACVCYSPGRWVRIG